MDLSNYIKRQARALPVFLLVDVSGSMSGSKIGTVNVAIKEMLSTFRGIENPKGIIKLSIITFGNGKVNILKPLLEITEADAYTLNADGDTPMGMGLDAVREQINDKNVVSSRDYTPTIVLISDGLPTDFPEYHQGMSTQDVIGSWENMRNLLSEESRASKSVRLAMGIGDDADEGILKAFINNGEIPVVHANDNATISNFFKWVTMSVSTRSVSTDPGKADTSDIKYCFDADSLKF